MLPFTVLHQPVAATTPIVFLTDAPDAACAASACTDQYPATRVLEVVSGHNLDSLEPVDAEEPDEEERPRSAASAATPPTLRHASTRHVAIR